MAKPKKAPEPAAGEGAGDELPRKKLSGKKIVLIAAPVLLLAIGGGVAYTMGLFGGGEEDAHGAETASAEGHGAEGGGEHGEGAPGLVFVDVPPFLVNLQSAERKASFLKLTVALEVPDQMQADEIQKKLPRIVDQFEVYLRELRLEDLSGSAGMFRLKEELLRRVNTGVAPHRVNDVLFKEMLVQ